MSDGGGRRGAEGRDEGAGEDFGLVVAAGAAAGPVEGDGDDEVDVREVRGSREAAAEEGAEVAAGGQVRVVLQGTRDRPVVSFVMHQGYGVCIVHGLGPPVAFKYRIEPVCQWVMRLKPMARIRHICRTGETQMPLAHAQPASAGQACPRHKQIAQCINKLKQPLHRTHNQKVYFS